MTGWRLLLSGPADGSRNMAVDETLLEGAASRERLLPPTLRIYAWSPAALSLGRSQPAASSHDGRWLRNAGVDLVRRPTGGRAVLHDAEITYAVVGRLRTHAFPGGVEDTYRRIAGAIVEALRALGVPAEARGTGRDPGPTGPPSCFATPAAQEIVAGERKLVGAAQARRRGAFLQHGSIPLRADPSRIAAALGSPVDPGAFTDLRSARGGSVEASDLVEALRRGFEARFGTELREDALTREEDLRVQELRAWKYDSAAWTLEGRIGRREARWGPPVPV